MWYWAIKLRLSACKTSALPCCTISQAQPKSLEMYHSFNLKCCLSPLHSEFYLKFESFPAPQQFLSSFSLYVVTFMDLFSYLCLPIELFHKCSSLSNEKREMKEYLIMKNKWISGPGLMDHGFFTRPTMFPMQEVIHSQEGDLSLIEWCIKERLGQIQQHCKQPHKCFSQGMCSIRLYRDSHVACISGGFSFPL